jgi:predicted nucleic acid-binding protein
MLYRGNNRIHVCPTKNRPLFGPGSSFGEPQVHPVTLEIAQLAGKVEGEQGARDISIAFEDLLIGTTALHLGYAVATLNVRHFRLIPGLSVIQL